MANGKTVTVVKKADKISKEDRLWEAIYELQKENKSLRQGIERILGYELLG